MKLVALLLLAYLVPQQTISGTLHGSCTGSPSNNLSPASLQLHLIAALVHPLRSLSQSSLQVQQQHGGRIALAIAIAVCPSQPRTYSTTCRLAHAPQLLPLCCDLSPSRALRCLSSPFALFLYALSSISAAFVWRCCLLGGSVSSSRWMGCWFLELGLDMCVCVYA